MTAKTLTVANIQLDARGRAVLDDSLLESISRHELGPALAGGTNASCANNRCTNAGCSDHGQMNTGCTNGGCGGNNNEGCENRYAGQDE